MTEEELREQVTELAHAALAFARRLEEMAILILEETDEEESECD